MTTSDGGNYYYVRCNWNANVNYGISQAIANLPAGMYKLTYKAATHSSSWNKSQHTVSLSESDGMTSTKTMQSTGTNWTNFETYLYKSSATSTLTIKVNMLAGDANSGQHYNLLVDDFKLYYCEDLGANASSPVDITGYISNAGVYSVNNTYVPRGWTSAPRSVGNDHYTENTMDTQLEAWSGGNMYFDYYQVISGLPNGVYTLSAKCHDSNGKGGFLYATAGSTTKTADMTTDYSTITTEKISVSDGSLRIGIKSETTSGGSWMTGDDFVLTFYGYDPTEALAALATQIASATFTEKHSGASETALQTAITAAQALVTAGTGTKAEIETASANLSTAVAAVNTSIADYAKLNAQIALAEPYSIVNPANVSAYAQAIADAKDGYANETIEDCAATIKNLTDYKVADYTYVSDNFKYSVDLDEKAWKTTGYVADFSNEHWSGTEHKYKNQDDSNGRGWNSSTGFTIGLNQDVTLPAGKYVFKACGRKSAGATMELSVKAGSTDLGKVTDFPNGSSARGINKDGETSFDEDNDAYANNGNGFGWQWRFIAFELTEETTINVSVSASATVAHEWASFGDYSVITDNEANLAMMTYNVALNSAKAAIANDTYKNVTGLEKSNLQTLIDADMTGKSSTEIESATAELKSATTAFTAAAPAYDAFIATMAMVENLDADGKKYFNSNSYVEMLLEAYDANEVLAEYFVELENVFKAAIKNQSANSDWTGLLVNPSFEDATGTFPNGWTTDRNTTGSFDYKLLEETLNTNETTDGKYVLNAWAPQIHHIYVKQIVNLPVGVYQLSAAVYSDRVSDQHIEAIANGTNYKSTTVSNNSWETLKTTFVVYQEGDVTVGIFSNGKNLSGNTDGWFRADNFKLTYLGKDIPVTIGESGYASFSASYDVVAPTGVEAYYATEATETSVKMTKIEGGKIPANTGVILKGTTGNYTFTATDETLVPPISNLLVAVTAAKKELAATDGSNTNYVLKNGLFVTWAEGVKTNVAAGKSYLSVPSSSTALSIDFDDATAINTVNANTFNGARVNLAGQVVGNGYKGIVIENGKKVLVK